MIGINEKPHSILFYWPYYYDQHIFFVPTTYKVLDWALLGSTYVALLTQKQIYECKTAKLDGICAIYQQDNAEKNTLPIRYILSRV